MMSSSTKRICLLGPMFVALVVSALWLFVLIYGGSPMAPLGQDCQVQTMRVSLLHHMPATELDVAETTDSVLVSVWEQILREAIAVRSGGGEPEESRRPIGRLDIKLIDGREVGVILTNNGMLHPCHEVPDGLLYCVADLKAFYDGFDSLCSKGGVTPPNPMFHRTAKPGDIVPQGFRACRP